MVDRTHRELTDEDIARIADTYHAWRGDKGAGEYADVPGFCKATRTEKVTAHGFVLTPGRYVDAADGGSIVMPFNSAMRTLVQELQSQFQEANRLERVILTGAERVTQ